MAIVLTHLLLLTVISAALVEELAARPEDVEVLFTAAPPHVTIELCPGKNGCNVERPIELVVDGNVADAEIVVFGFTVSFKRLICARKPVDDVNSVIIYGWTPVRVE
ncbi:hypothetical protein V6N12_072916 [Hibiscus sabdariffa]|uniref:Uncharacterized protein n=1 Tax=Hibiscus sabdariffa TaxID=183260 RepID=A0ABR2B4I4_9ROSI